MSDGTSRNRRTPLGPTDKPEPEPTTPRRKGGGQRSEAPNQSFESGAGENSVSAEDPAALAGNHLGDNAYPEGNNIPPTINDDRDRKQRKRPLPKR